MRHDQDGEKADVLYTEMGYENTTTANGKRKKKFRVVAQNPRKGRGSYKLPDLMQYHKHIYLQALTNLRLGASLSTVAAILGVSYPTFTAWLHKGRHSKRHPYRKFFTDIMEAVGEARLIAEAEVKSRDPYKWLRYSAASRIVGDEWRDDVELKSSVELIGSGIGPGQNPGITQQDLMEALVELRRAGIDLNTLAEQGRASLAIPAHGAMVVPSETAQVRAAIEHEESTENVPGIVPGTRTDLEDPDDEEESTWDPEHLGDQPNPSLPENFIEEMGKGPMEVDPFDPRPYFQQHSPRTNPL
jgi:hypothetical protein